MASVTEGVHPGKHVFVTLLLGQVDDSSHDFAHMFSHVELIYCGGTKSACKDAESATDLVTYFARYPAICRLEVRISSFARVRASNDFDIQLVAEPEHFVAAHSYFDSDGCLANQCSEVTRPDRGIRR